MGINLQLQYNYYYFLNHLLSLTYYSHSKEAHTFFGKKMWHILYLEKVLDHDNCGYAFASQATHLFLPQNTNKIK